MHKESNTIIHLELLQECSEKVGCIFSGVTTNFSAQGQDLMTATLALYLT